MLKYTELTNVEVFEIASSIKFISSSFEKAYKNTGVAIYFKEYKNKEEADNEFSIGHFHIHIVPNNSESGSKNELNLILEEDDKDFILNYKKKLMQESLITRKNLESIQSDGLRIREIVFNDIKDSQND